jgi:hypothetical protein
MSYFADLNAGVFWIFALPALGLAGVSNETLRAHAARGGYARSA